MKKLLLSFMLILSTALVASEKVELFKDNNINATHFSSAVITKTIEGEKIVIKLIVGHNLFGKLVQLQLKLQKQRLVMMKVQLLIFLQLKEMSLN